MGGEEVSEEDSLECLEVSRRIPLWEGELAGEGFSSEVSCKRSAAEEPELLSELAEPSFPPFPSDLSSIRDDSTEERGEISGDKFGVVGGVEGVGIFGAETGIGDELTTIFGSVEEIEGEEEEG
jgi:hypothetical protein